MKNTGELILSIEEKVRIVTVKLQEMNARCEELTNENSALYITIAEQEKIINELKKRIETIKIAKALESTEGKTEARSKIDGILREIDKCLGLLNR